MKFRTSTLAFLGGILVAGAAPAGEYAFETGRYAITYRLELPHVERWAIERTATICVAKGALADAIPVPVLSANTPFAACRARNVRRDGRTVAYEIVCPGRDAARAKARYIIAPDGFSGRIAMVMGAKNMTMAEIQAGRRLGGCGQAGVLRTVAPLTVTGQPLPAEMTR